MKSKTLILVFLLTSFSSGFSQNGKLQSKELIDLSKDPIWDYISDGHNLLPEFQYLKNLNIYSISYLGDGLEIEGIIIEPKKEGKYPIVIFNRGGNRDFGRINVGMLVHSTSKLADKGYVIIASNYRVQDEFGGNEINDVLYLMETAKELEKADTSRIGMYGWSRGGMMTYLALQKSNKIKTAVIGNGPTDLFGIIADRPRMETHVIAECVPNYWENKDEELKKRSAIYWADELCKKSSLLILRGNKDQRVNPEQSDKIAQELTKINYDYKLMKFDTDHYFSDKKDELNSLVIEWFKERL